MRDRSGGGIVVRGATYIVLAGIIAPVLLMFAVSFTETKYIAFPPKGFTWQWYRAAVNDPEFVSGLSISARVAVISSLLSAALGIMGGLTLTRYAGRFERPLTVLFIAPLTIPIIVYSLGLLFFFSSLGLVRSLLGLIIGHTVMTFPYSVRMVTAALGRMAREVERAAAVLGATPWQRTLRVTLPTIRPGVVAAMLFSFLISLSNVTIALFISGARTQTLPVIMFQRAKHEVSPEMAAMASAMVVMTFALMLVLERRYGIYEFLERRRGA